MARRLADLLAVATGELLPDRLDHLPLARHHFQRQRHVLAKLAQAIAAAAFTSRRSIHYHPFAGKVLQARPGAGNGRQVTRFVEQRVAGRHDEPRSGGPRTIDDARIEAVIVRTLESCPENATHWSSRGMAKASGLSVSAVQRIWRAFGLQPHRLETFKLSADPNFAAKVRDVVGLYVSPPAHAIVLCVD
ncbi:hypothetical protein ABH973_000784 [Bradyrhizobium ottawaense]